MDRLEKGSLLDKEWDKLKSYAKELEYAGKDFLFVDEIDEKVLFQKCRLMHAQGNLDVVVIDLGSYNEVCNPIEKSLIIKRFKELARCLSVPVFIFDHQNNLYLHPLTIRKRMFEAYTYSQGVHADKVLFVNNKAKPEDIALYVCKNGMKGNQTIFLKFDRLSGNVDLSYALSLVRDL
jgi:hypothetical protein